MGVRVLLVLVLSCGCLAAQVPTAASTFVDAAVMRIEQDMKKHGVPGLSVAIGSKGKLILNRGFGFADLENKVPATHETIYRLASISKPITAVAVMRLWEQGKLDLDAPVQNYVKSFPAKKWKLTSRHLLSHLGGIRHYRGPDEILSSRRYRNVVSPLKIFRDDPLLWEPGTRYSYTTYGYNLLGAVAAKAAGKKFVELVREAVFVPAGMRHAAEDDHYRIIPHRAQGYRKLADGRFENSPPVDTSNKIPGGGLCSRAEDLVFFGQALLQDKLVKPATRKLMWTRAKTKDGKAVRYGKGFGIVRSKQTGVRISHSGAQPRVSTLLVILPEEQLVVALMCNMERARLAGLARALFDLWKAQPKK